MRIAGSLVRDTGARVELILLLAASLSCAIVLTVAAVGTRSGATGSFRLAYILAIAVSVGLLVAAVVRMWRSTSLARRIGRRKQDEIAELRRNLAAAESM